MRTTTKRIVPTCSSSSCSQTIWSDGTPAWKRSTPVWQSWTEPFLVQFTQIASDLSEGSTRQNWNNFENYKLSNNFNRTRGVRLGTTKMAYMGMDVFDCPNPLVFNGCSLFGSADAPIEGLPALRATSGTEIIPPPVGLALLRQNALRAMLPGIRPELSLVNSVIELKDFKTLPKTLSRMLKIAKRGKKTLRQILGGGADAYLQKEFNIMPLLADISGFRKALANTKKQVDKLLALEAKKLTRHYNVSLASPYMYRYDKQANTPQTYGFSETCGVAPGIRDALGNCTYNRYVSYQRAQFHAEIEYTYYLSGYDKQNAYTSGLMDALGVNLNPAIIWNAIPWSFAIDWVIGIGRWLDQFKVSNLEPVTVIHRFLWSTDVARTIILDVESNIDVPGLRANYRINTCSETAYKRWVEQVSVNELLVSGLSLKEFCLAGALALTRHRR